MSTLTVAAHAKLNLSLRVLAREETGYHSLETLFLRLELADELTIRTGGVDLDLEVSGDPEVPVREANLCWQAAELLGRTIGRPIQAAVELRKRIPIGAGLGGGSADAGAVLQALNAALGEPLDAATLTALGGQLGSDVPFALCESPMALAWERGRRLLPLAPPSSRPVLIVVPDFTIATRDAYGWLAADREAGLARAPEAGELPGAADLASWGVLADVSYNDFEDSVFRRHPDLESVKRRLEDVGAAPALLCGSGSSVAGVFCAEASLDQARDAVLHGTRFRVIATRTAAPAGAG